MSFEEDISYLLGDIAHYKELLADVSNVKVDTSVLKTSSTPAQSVTNSLSNLQITSTKDFDKPSVKSDLGTLLHEVQIAIYIADVLIVLETIGKILSHDATKLTLIAPNSPPAAIPILRSTQTTLLKLFQTFFLLSPFQIGKTTHSQLQTLTSEILSAVKNHVEQFLPANSKLRKHDAKSGKKNNKNIESQTSSVGLLPNTGILWTLCADLKNFSLSNNICCKRVIDRLIEQINDAVNELQEEIDGIDNDFDEFDEEEEDGVSTLVGLDRSEAELAALKNSMKLVKSVKLLFTKITKNMEAELFDIETGDSVVEMAKRCVEAVDDYVCDDAGERAPEKLFGVLEGLCDLIVSYGQREKKLGEKDEKWYELFKGQIVTLKNNMNSG
ncbi:hypothetical protein HK098_005698 [Nowakowskiella sp. JEL0407]|nr:hypothetical protein HK098_005698 [Nowakowskiella sp. JEL0407]